MINCYYFKETLLYIFMKFSSESHKNNLFFFLTTDVAEVFTAYVELSYYLASQITTIFIGCQFFFLLVCRIICIWICLFEKYYLNNNNLL